MLNVRFWHKADTQLTNNSFQCWWAGGTSINHALLPLLEILCKPTLTLFFKNTLSILARKYFSKLSISHLPPSLEKNACFSTWLRVCFVPKADIQHQGLVNPPAILPTSEILVVLRLLRYFCYATNMEPTRRWRFIKIMPIVDRATPKQNCT